MKKIFLTYCLVTLGLASSSLLAQNMIFSQYYASELYLSPCFAAKETHPTLSGVTRTQWASTNLPIQSNQLSFIYPIWSESKRTTSNIGGVGVSFFNDQAGSSALKRTGVSLSLAYNLRLTDDELNNLYFGLQLGYLQWTANEGAIQTGSQYNPAIGYDENLSSNASVSSGEGIMDFAAGVSYYYNHEKNNRISDLSANVGLSAFHLSSPEMSLVSSNYTDELAIALYGGLTYHLTDRIYLSPQALALVEKEKTMVNVGAYMNYILMDKHTVFVPHKIRLGSWYRFDEAIIPLIGFGNDYYNLGLSYDVNASDANSYVSLGSTYEISLQMMFYKADRERPVVSSPKHQLLSE